MIRIYPDRVSAPGLTCFVRGRARSAIAHEWQRVMRLPICRYSATFNQVRGFGRRPII